MGKCYGKLLDTCCPSSPEEEMAQDYMARNDIYDVPDKVSKTFQWILLISVAVEFFIAVGFVVFGIYGYNVRQEFGNPSEIDDTFIEILINLPLAMIIIGAITIFFTFLGGLGAIREYVPLLATYLVYLILVTLAEAFVGIYFLAKKEDIMSDVDGYFSTKGIQNYFEDVDLKNLIDYLQEGFDCCGSVTYTEWNNNMYFNCTKSNPSIQACSVPSSCCRTEDYSTGMDIIINSYCGKGTLSMEDTMEVQKKIYTDGCHEKIADHLSGYTVTIIIVILVLIIGPIVQEICIAFLIYDVNAEREAFEMWKGEQVAMQSVRRQPMAQPVEPLLAAGPGEPGWRTGPVVAPYQGGSRL